jgi:dTDP-4-dehydrorhamnose reductase
LLILGSTGLLGQALAGEALSRAWPCSGVARSGSDHDVDVTDVEALTSVICESSAQIIVNCVAVTSHEVCERQPERAYLVNARTPGILAALSAELGIKFVQISTDHYFTGDGARLHDEDAEVQLLNEYARTKYAGERFALTNPGALVIRTNIVGLRRWADRPTFAEWAIAMIVNARPMTLFDDFFTSSMHARACASALLDLVRADASGLINVGSSEVSSKRAFVHALARALDVDLSGAAAGSVRDLVPRRAESLGLDVTRAQSLLMRRLPGLGETAAAVASEARGLS